MPKKTFDFTGKPGAGLKWFNYRQNNSGGSFVKDDDVSINVVVQAHSPDEANSIAENRAGVYFNGVAKGWDCDCCGDRWSESWDDEDMKDFHVSYWVSGKGYVTKELDSIEAWAEAQNQSQDCSNSGESSVILYYYNGPKVVYYRD